jgi:ferrochelatase
VDAAIKALADPPELRTVRDFHDDPRYIAALAASVREFWEKRGHPDLLVISFHGVPRRSVNRGDPYYEQCLTTAKLLAQALGLPDGRFRATFQSRFGRAEWLQPYTAEVLTELGRAGTGCVDVVCPGFVSDCLETLEEIAFEGKRLFMDAGGRELRYIPCLNDRDVWIKALTDITARNLQGWVEPPPPDPQGGRFRDL